MEKFENALDISQFDIQIAIERYHGSSDQSQFNHLLFISSKDSSLIGIYQTFVTTVSF